jgi:Macrocin-O-methyltransferase (TylF)
MNSKVYEQDGLTSIHNHDFMDEPSFIRAYQRGVKAVGKDYHWHWRVYIGLWAARTAIQKPGDFVECGVNAGFLSSSIMHDLDWDSRGRNFYLLDTFAGIDPRHVSPEELQDGILRKNAELITSGFYVASVESVRNNFSEWKNLEIIEGVIPDTLSRISATQVAFLHIDLNCAPPEVAAIEYLWSRLVSGALVLLDDYAYSGYHHQKAAMDRFAQSRNISIASLPTGQGLIIKA